MISIRRLWWLLLPAISAVIFAVMFLAGCGGFFGICSYVLEELPPPVPDSFQRTELGIGVYTDDSGTWKNTPAVRDNVDNQVNNMIRCAEETLDATINLTIEPAEKMRSIETQSVMSEIEIISQSSVFHGADMTDEELAEIHPDEYPPDMLFESLDMSAPTEERAESSVVRSRVLEGTIESDFKFILSDKNACLRKNHVNGFTAWFDGALAVWVNELGQLAGHEITHVLANVLGLTEEEEGLLEECTPDITHSDA